MSSHRIAATNLGPISEAEFFLKSPGVTVLVAPNGSGKTILLESIQAAARGEGKLPLKDRTRKGSVEAFGATITIGGTCRHTGSFEVTNLEGRFDLSALVDPRIKSPAAADKARIKALVSLTGVEADAGLFRRHEAFDDFDSIVTPEALATDDLVEMAAKVKARYDESALSCERRAEREFGQASALVTPSDIDLSEESDESVLQEAYNAARDEVTRLEEQAKNAAKIRDQVQKAEELLQEFGEKELTEERSERIEWLETVDSAVDEKNRDIQKLLALVEARRAEIKSIQSQAVDSRARVATIDRQLESVAKAKAVLSDRTMLAPPDDQDIADAKEEQERAAAAITLGVKIREAKKNAAKAREHRKQADQETQRAGRYRDAAKATDEVLSGCIQCPHLRVESDGKTARLVTDHPIRGASIPYHDLSDGEKWTIAIDIGADQVGEGGLLVISQIGWEGIDGLNRLSIHEHAVKRGVYILTAEASSDPNAKREIVAVPMGDSPEMPQAPQDEQPAEPAEKPAARKPKAKKAPPASDGPDDIGDVPW